ncbi:MAG: peptidase S41 [Bacteroidetes bacterium HGW-Bacteroidetes-7]|jgi:carboxyl-terminal processing protease|nr:MAG: peptidase S41 [Bacteroidetes bacterium HGW-Bacteroidetes-7]
MNRIILRALIFITLLVPVAATGQSAAFKLGKNLDIQLNVLRELSYLYVDSVEADKMIIAAINAMLEGLDPYTVLIPEEDRENLELLTTGSYGGIGSIIKKTNEGIVITEVNEFSPAARAGIVAGDIILSIDGVSVEPLQVDECSAKMKGTPGTQVEFTIKTLREGLEKRVTITREKIHFPDVPYSGMITDTTGYIRISGFTIGGSKDVKRALLDLKKNPNLKRVILDLRGNGGGILDEAVDIVSLFVPRGTKVVSAIGRFRQADMIYYTREEPVDTLIPLVVLVNSSSASSSEIVAGALQDLDRATIAGTRTFGKGLVQSIRDVGFNYKIKLTTAKYYTPSGRCVQAIDYSQRNEDGSLGNIPDSLIKEFKTLKGRSVYDGGGVTPDVYIQPKTYSRPAMALIYGDVLQEYSVDYYKNNLSIATPSKFLLTDAEYEKFVVWASDKNFDHRTSSEVEYDKLIALAVREGLYTELKDDLTKLGEKIKPGKAEVLRKNKSEIKALLEEEISSRYYYQRGRVESMIRSDDQLHNALNIKLIE